MRVTFPIHVDPECDFPITNIPFGIFSTEALPTKRAGTAIGNLILDLSILEKHAIFDDVFKNEDLSHLSTKSPETSVFAQGSLNSFAALPATTRTTVRNQIISLLQDENSALFGDPELNEATFHDQKEIQMHLPMQIGDFTDFLCARVHSDNCSRMAGVSTAPSFYAFPTAYNGRSSSVVVSGTAIHRPCGMLRIPNTPDFTFSSSKRIDYELEMGFFVSKPVPFGKNIKAVNEAKDHIFGFVMLNDWSSRDIQFAEMTPLGPFNGKGSGTAISPWVVTLDALEDVQVGTGDTEAAAKMAQRPSHLKHEDENHTWDIGVEVALKREGWEKPVQIAGANLRDMYWSPAQMLAHHASSGCGLRTGDLLGTGTLSSPETKKEGVSSLGCLHELTKAGIEPFVLSNGEKVTWIDDGDEIVLTGRVLKKDGSVIGFGDCSGVLLGAAI